ncbi:MAG: sigma-70 family RNA polymerase sigma factor [Planctomycetota bacterium]|nr:sigma-70 family RNA polymerase sigma factor [Planctomycetota bacterium]
MNTDHSSQPTVQTLFLQHAAAVRGFVLGLVADRAAADDIVQEVFLTVVQKEADSRRDEDFLPWVRGIARNKVLENYRRQRSGTILFDQEMIGLLAVSGETSDDKWQRRREALAQCLERLAPRAREVVDLRYADQPLAPPELARRIGWTTNAVNAALARARAFLRECTRQVLAGGEVS